ncbi:MAG: hypothetical protein LBF12_01140 [Christensenellaceae bacterium]|jgi:hypothetical protein|nr:hypothetical protein [Christensenellaceae bacterium]
MGKFLRAELFKHLIIPFTLIIMIATALVTSFAWFYKNAEIDTSDTSITSQTPLTANLSSSLIESLGYAGETGLGSPGTKDAPFFVGVNINIVSNTSNLNCTLSINLDNFVATHGTLADTSKYIISSSVSDNYFTFRLLDNDETEYYINSSNIVARLSDSEPYAVRDGNNEFTLKIIYLPKNSYEQWTAGDFTYPPSTFSDLKYVGAKFYFTLNYLIRPRVTE